MISDVDEYVLDPRNITGKQKHNFDEDKHARDQHKARTHRLWLMFKTWKGRSEDSSSITWTTFLRRLVAGGYYGLWGFMVDKERGGKYMICARYSFKHIK